MGNVGQLKKALQDIDDSVIVMLYSYSGEDQEWRGCVLSIMIGIGIMIMW